MIALAGIAIILPLGILIERFSPARACSLRGTIFNLVCLVPLTLLRGTAALIIMSGTVAMTNWLGGGVMTLPYGGFWFIPAIAAYTVVMDLGEYLFHRAQHRMPALWAMHSFHHSDQSLDISTTPRHFWAEQALKAATIYFLIGLLFKANEQIIALYGIISFLNYFFHMNVCVGFGRGWFLLNSPQYHRVHHSSLSEHRDRNFAALFPIFDAIFGTAYRPHASEYPPTGLDDHDSPQACSRQSSGRIGIFGARDKR